MHSSFVVDSFFCGVVEPWGTVVVGVPGAAPAAAFVAAIAAAFLATVASTVVTSRLG